MEFIPAVPRDASDLPIAVDQFCMTFIEIFSCYVNISLVGFFLNYLNNFKMENNSGNAERVRPSASISHNLTTLGSMRKAVENIDREVLVQLADFLNKLVGSPLNGGDWNISGYRCDGEVLSIMLPDPLSRVADGGMLAAAFAAYPEILSFSSEMGLNVVKVRVADVERVLIPKVDGEVQDIKGSVGSALGEVGFEGLY